jgi:pyochelin synthetase
VMDRCYEQVAAALAVVLSGAAYLPIDASWPAERRSKILRQADCRVVVTTATIRGSQQWAADLTVVSLADKSVVDQPDTPLDGAGPRLDDLAYVIFTSGSTGTPKGVMIEHRSAVNTVLDINRRFGVCETDRVLALSSLSFDLSVWDIFGMFAAGGAVVLPSGSGGASATEWTAQMRTFGVTIWNSVPALLQAWLDESSEDKATADIPLRLAMLSGDWIPVRMPGQLAGVFPGAQFVSLGGATEAAIWSVIYPVGEIGADWTRIPYGRPMRNQTLHVYDPEWQQCPDWVTGEIYIGGLGVARGYWADAERTGQRFVTHPETAERLYRTGDLGRYMANGDIEILGREDQQVKINGYRIELGDVSAAITQHPQVSDAVVTVDVHPATGSRQLVAYVTPAAAIRADVAPVLDEASVKAATAAALPGYMVPHRVVVLDRFPLSANGKVDRSKLPQPGMDSQPAGSQSPRTALEQSLHAIWADTLGNKDFGVDDNFFELGGDSLHAMRILSRLHDELGFDGDASDGLRMLFLNPTVAGLAGSLVESGPVN